MPCLIERGHMITLAIDYNTQRRQRRSWSEKANERCRSALRRVTLLPKAAVVAIFTRQTPRGRPARAAAGLLV
jgi:hypothetical protein